MDRPTHVPLRLAIIDASPEASDGSIAHLLADFEEALRVYEHYSAWAVPDAEGIYGQNEDGTQKGLPIEHVRWSEQEGCAPSEGGSAPLVACDSILLGFMVEGADPPEPVLESFEHAIRFHELAPGARVYAVAVTDAYEAGCVLPAYERLEQLCDAHDLVWSGGLAVGGGTLVPEQAGTARMGGKRRARSEGIDVVIAAVRSGTDVSRFSRDGENIVMACCPMPRFAYDRRARKRYSSR